VYAFAGNDTTAIALTNLVIHLSANPETQDWIAEELQHYLPSDDPESWNYNHFKNLKRCGAVIVSSALIILTSMYHGLRSVDGDSADMSSAFSAC
jgi:hypothetical protein